MVVRNELNRYLRETLVSFLGQVDEAFIYDDRSNDGTYDFACGTAAQTMRRPVKAASFAENEGEFRHAAWRAMEAVMKPRLGDWILCLDADEVILGSVRDEVANATADALVLDVVEVFGFDDDDMPLVRLDGFWGAITACRLVRWRRRGAFAQVVEGGGSIPLGWEANAVPAQVRILHYGYATEADRQIKYRRYAPGSGHNPVHIRSILEPGRLQRLGEHP